MNDSEIDNDHVSEPWIDWQYPQEPTPVADKITTAMLTLAFDRLRIDPEMRPSVQGWGSAENKNHIDQPDERETECMYSRRAQIP